jgi:hypothetical protein
MSHLSLLSDCFEGIAFNLVYLEQHPLDDAALIRLSRWVDNFLFYFSRLSLREMTVFLDLHHLCILLGSVNHGGRRPGAGRPKNIPSKAVRLPVDVADKARSGYFSELEAVLFDYLDRAAGSDTSQRDWTRCNELLDEVRAVLSAHDVSIED